MRLPEVQEQLPKQGLSFTATTPQQFADFVKAEKDKWGELVRAVGVKADRARARVSARQRGHDTLHVAIEQRHRETVVAV